ncbi:MAG: DUF1643 domain-containing protein [Prochlorococcaceae cyanobacterium]
MPPPQPSGGRAAFSPCGHYRWWLARRWDPALPRLLFIGLNPSAADGRRDDPTLRRLQGFARSGGFGSLELLNVFARVSASPAALRRASDPVGPANDRWIRRRLAALMAAAPAGSAIALGWGNGGTWRGRDRQVQELLKPAARELPLLCLGMTASGQPLHPLYLPAATAWQPWQPWPAPGRCQSGMGAASCGSTPAPPPAAPWPAPPVATTCT